MSIRDDSPRDDPPLTPDEVGARVSVILAEAERDAREIIESAHRDAAREHADLVERDDALGLGALTRAVESLTARVSALERANIAAELRSMMAEAQIEQLLDDVLERA